jgi:amidase
MHLDEYTRYDVMALAELVRTRQIKPEELAHLATEAANLVNPNINAVIELYDSQLIPSFVFSPPEVSKVYSRCM